MGEQISFLRVAILCDRKAFVFLFGVGSVYSGDTSLVIGIKG